MIHDLTYVMFTIQIHEELYINRMEKFKLYTYIMFSIISIIPHLMIGLDETEHGNTN